MDQTQTIIDRARALLAAATPGPVTVYPHPRPRQDHDESRFQWGDLVTGGRSMWTMIPMADAEALAFAVNNLGAICDAMERAHFAAEWWASEYEDVVHDLRVLGESFIKIERTAGAMMTFIEQAVPLLHPDQNGIVRAPNHVTATMVSGNDEVEFTIRRTGGKTPADVIGELTARAEAAEHARDIFLDALGRIGAMCLGVLGDEWEGAPHDEMVGGLIDRAEEAVDELDALRAKLAETTTLHGIAEARERRLERELLAIWATVRPDESTPRTEAGVLHAVEDVQNKTDALRAEVEKESALRAELTREVQRLRTRVDAVGQVLSENGCDCECGCPAGEHGDDCDRCLACRVQDAVMEGGAE